MKHLLCLGVAALLTMQTGCQRKPANVPATPVAAGADVNPPAVPAAPAGVVELPPAVAPATNLEQSKPGASESGNLNGPLTGAVARFKDKHMRLPVSWQELVQGGFIKAIPQPPPGKRFAIDPVSHMVVEQ